MNDILSFKAQLRNEFRSNRKKIRKDQSVVNQYRFHHQIKSLKLTKLNIAVFASNDGEPNLFYSCRQLQTKKNNLYLPIVTGLNQALVFGIGNSINWSYLPKNRFNIVEPYKGKKVNINQLDVLLVPLVAFDCMGNRLGMGGGFYDRTFAQIKNQKKSPILIGIAWQSQYYEKILPKEKTDIPLDLIITPKNILYF